MPAAKQGVTYTSSRKWKVTIWILAVLLVSMGLFVYWAFLTAEGEPTTPIQRQLVYVFVICTTALATLALLEVYRAQIILRSDSLLYRTLFSSQQLRRESITSGRTFTYHGLTIMRLAHASEERKETTLTLYFQPDQQFYRWFDPVPDINGIDALEGN